VLVLSCRAEFPSNLISSRSNFRSPLVKFCASGQLPVRVGHGFLSSLFGQAFAAHFCFTDSI
jgi:hypothetical protein